MLENERIYFRDIIDSIKNIEQYTKGFTADDFIGEQKTIDAVVRNLEIIGEAARYITQKTKQKYSQIPWKQIIAMRNKVIHEYAGVDVEILWKTVKEDIPDLKSKIMKII